MFWLGLATVLLLGYRFAWVLDPLWAWAYDGLTGQEVVDVYTPEDFRWVSFDELPTHEQAKYADARCEGLAYAERTSMKVRGLERYQNVIGELKLYQLMTPDRLIRGRVRIPHLVKTHTCW